MRQISIIFASATILLFFSVINSWSSDIPDNQTTASISIGAEFSSGTYNTDTTTRILYMPVIVSWFPHERLDMSVELPFINQTYQNQNSTTTVSPKTTARFGGAGGIISTTSSTSTSSTTTIIPIKSSGSSSSVSGLGDIILRAGFIPLFEHNSLPQVRASLLVKTPTASFADGLGTGEFDFGGGLDLSKWFGNIHLGGEAIYTYQGKVSGLGLKNYLSYTGTVGYQATDNLQPMLVIKGSTAPSDYSDDLLEVRGRMLWYFSPTTALDLFVTRGISKSSADYGGGLAVIHSF
ncbi:MAG: hypothetical protein HGB32_14140 [Geobacteraceae bacterium]|nr:hypothetical protein [Geobacteraceae bacterium]NTW81265.1 hypothetical protein [Geobacteraceae bacterium]